MLSPPLPLLFVPFCVNLFQDCIHLRHFCKQTMARMFHQPVGLYRRIPSSCSSTSTWTAFFRGQRFSLTRCLGWTAHIVFQLYVLHVFAMYRTWMGAICSITFRMLSAYIQHASILSACFQHACPAHVLACASNNGSTVHAISLRMQHASNINLTCTSHFSSFQWQPLTLHSPRAYCALDAQCVIDMRSALLVCSHHSTLNPQTCCTQ